MRVKTISVTYGRKFNLGDFNSATVDCTAWADLDLKQVVQGDGTVTYEQGEPEAGVYDTLFQQVKDQVRKQALPILRPQYKAVLDQLESVQLDQAGLKGILASLIANGSVEIKLVSEPRETPGAQAKQAIPKNTTQTK